MLSERANVNPAPQASGLSSWSPLNAMPYLLGYLAVLYARPHEFSSGTANLPLLSVLLVLAFVLWLTRQPKNFEAPQFVCMPMILLACLVSLVRAGWLGGAWLSLKDFTPIVVLFFIIATTVDSMARLRQVFFVLALAVAAISAHGVVQWSGGELWSGVKMVEQRITYLGFLNDPNDLAMALLMLVPLILFLAGGAGFFMRWAYRAVAAAAVFNVYLCNSRGATLALGAMLFMHGLWRYGVWRSLFVVPLLLVPLLLLGPSRMGEMSADEASAEGRIEAWYEGMLMILSRPVFGVGKGLFMEHHNLTAHNSFILVAAELGTFGYFFWFANLVLTWLMLRRIGALKPDPQDLTSAGLAWAETHRASRALWLGYVGGLVAAFFLSRSYLVILYVHIGLVVAVFQLARSQRPDMPAVRLGDIWGRMLLASLASLVALWALTRTLLAFT